MKEIERVLSKFYKPENYQQMGAKVVERVGTVGILETNEQLIADNIKLFPKPDGYIIGVGNGAIWLMLDLFQKGVPPKGVISLDRDPCVILSGKITTKLAKREITPEEAVAFFYNGKIDDILQVAKTIAQNEKNDLLKQEFDNAINTGQFACDLELLHQLEINPSAADIRRRKNVTTTILRHWSSITRLARNGRIVFLHSDVSNETTLEFIISHLPDVSLSRNILYLSNIVDKRYRNEIHSWEMFNTFGESWYIFTSAKDDYILQSSHSPPAYHELPL